MLLAAGSKEKGPSFEEQRGNSLSHTHTHTHTHTHIYICSLPVGIYVLQSEYKD